MVGMKRGLEWAECCLLESDPGTGSGPQKLREGIAEATKGRVWGSPTLHWHSHTVPTPWLEHQVFTGTLVPGKQRPVASGFLEPVGA